MVNNSENLTNKRENISQEKVVNDRQVNINSSTPEVLSNPIYTPGFLRTQIGKLMRIEFLIGTNNLVDRIGFLEDVGTSYILLRSFEGDSMIYADLYSIKFITISATYSGKPPFQTYNNINNTGMYNMKLNSNGNY